VVQNVEFVNVKPGGTYSDHWALKELPYSQFPFTEPYNASVNKSGREWNTYLRQFWIYQVTKCVPTQPQEMNPFELAHR